MTQEMLINKLLSMRDKLLKQRNTASKKLDNSMFVFQGKIELIDEIIEMLRR